MTYLRSHDEGVLVIHYFPLISDTTKANQLPYVSLAYTQAHMYMHADVHTHTRTHTLTEEHSASSAVSTGSAWVRGLTSGRRYGERCRGWWWWWFGIKLSVVGPTGDETTGEVRQLTGWDSSFSCWSSYAESERPSTTALNRPVSMTEDERVTERKRERFAYSVSDFNIESTHCLSFYMNLKSVWKVKSTKGWDTDFKLLRDDRS